MARRTVLVFEPEYHHEEDQISERNTQRDEVVERPVLDLREMRRYKGRRERADTFEIRSASAPHFVPPQSDGTVDRVQNAHLGRCVLFERSHKPIRARIL